MSKKSNSITSEEIDDFLSFLNDESRQNPTTSTTKKSSSTKSSTKPAPKRRKIDENNVASKPNPFLKPKPKFGEKVKFGNMVQPEEKPKLARQLAMVENIPLPGQLEEVDKNERKLELEKHIVDEYMPNIQIESTTEKHLEPNLENFNIIKQYFNVKCFFLKTNIFYWTLSPMSIRQLQYGCIVTHIAQDDYDMLKSTFETLCKYKVLNENMYIKSELGPFDNCNAVIEIMGVKLNTLNEFSPIWRITKVIPNKK